MSTRVVLDPGSESEFVIRRPAIAKIAQSLPWMPPEKNPEVLKVLKESIAGEELVVDVDAATADPGSRLAGAELLVSLQLQPGSAPDQVKELIERVSSFWSRSEEFASSVDSVSIKLRT